MTQKVEQITNAPVITAQRRKLPDDREAITHKFNIAGYEGYITVGLYADGMPGELFLVMAKEGSAISGFADAFAQAISYALQYGVPLEVLVNKFSHVRFEPSGKTRNPEVPFAKSIVDYVFRWLEVRFIKQPERLMRPASHPVAQLDPTAEQNEGPPCTTCGEITVRSGAGFNCAHCGHYIKDV